jgi:hypothetical protein
MERTRLISLAGVLVLAAALAACSSSPASNTVTLGAPTLVTPAAGASVAYTAQPITLTVTNVSGVGASATYTFEVASDSSFATIKSTKTATANSSGQTSVQADTLAASTTYYWRAHVTDGSNVGPNSTVSSFAVGSSVQLAAPVPVSPSNGTATGGWPTLVVNNAVRTGPAGTTVYKFEISSSSSFSTIQITSTVSEGSGRTSYSPSSSGVSATVGSTYYWRVTAIDTANSATSAASTVMNFTYSSLAEAMAAIQKFTLWPGTKPTGTYGHVKISRGWDYFVAVSPMSGETVASPTLEIIRLLDLLDRGYDAPSAITFLQGTYGTTAAWYPDIVEGVIGFTYHYMAKTNGEWELVFRSGY